MQPTNAPIRTRALPPARLVALLLVTALGVGLGWLWRSNGDHRVAVPSGARAGQLTLHPCRYPTEAGSLPPDGGTLVVPENRHAAGSRLIALPVTRIRARAAHRPGVPLFRLQGGPGQSNMTFPQASRFVRDR